MEGKIDQMMKMCEQMKEEMTRNQKELIEQMARVREKANKIKEKVDIIKKELQEEIAGVKEGQEVLRTQLKARQDTQGDQHNYSQQFEALRDSYSDYVKEVKQENGKVMKKMEESWKQQLCLVSTKYEQEMQDWLGGQKKRIDEEMKQIKTRLARSMEVAIQERDKKPEVFREELMAYQDGDPFGSCSSQSEALVNRFLEVKPFRGEVGESPWEYLESLRILFEVNKLSEKEKLAIAVSTLKSRAKDWWLSQVKRPEKYQEYQQEVLAEYWSTAKQLKVQTRIFQEKYKGDKGENCTQFFYRQVAQLRTLIAFPRTEKEMIEAIQHNLPRPVAQALIIADRATIKQAAELIEKIECNEKQGQNYGYGRNDRNMSAMDWPLFEARKENTRCQELNTHRARDQVPFRGDNRKRTKAPTCLSYPNNIPLGRRPACKKQTNIDTNAMQGKSAKTQGKSFPPQISGAVEGGVGTSQELVKLLNNITLERDDGNDEIYNIQTCPKMCIIISGISVQALVDTGSQISVISERFYDQLVESGVSLPTLPVKQTDIRLANGKKARIKTIQIWAELSIKSDVKMECALLVMPNLIHDVVLGSDFLHTHLGVIDYRKRIVICQGVELPFITPELFESPGVCCLEWENLKELKKKCADSVVLTEKESQHAYNFLEKYVNVFSESPGVIKGYVHQIRVRENEPYQARMYPIPFQYEAEVKKELNRMLEWGVIEKRPSAYNNPLIVVKKKDGTVRLCLDARQLNKITIPERDTPPPINEALTRFKNKKMFSTVDLTASYWQIDLCEEDRKYTAFKHAGHSYVFTRMPFGLINSGAGLIRCLDRVLSEKVKSFITTYVDDIVIASVDLAEHLEHLQMFLSECSERNIKINLKKSVFFSNEIEFLGHVVGCGGVRPHPDKIDAIQKFPVPEKKKQIRSFLGLCNFYSKFYPGFAYDSQSLLKLIRKDVKWSWTKREEDDFRRIKQTFLKTVILAYPDFNKPFYVQTDSSGFGMGVVLFQLDHVGKPGVLYFCSKLLKGAELNYSVTEKETLAIVWAFQKFKQFLLGSEVIVITDHRCLEFLNRSYLSNERLIRWSLFLQQFNYKVQYCPGKQNVIADILSRNPVPTIPQHRRVEDTYVVLMSLALDSAVERDLARIDKLQQADPEFGPLISKLKQKGGNLTPNYGFRLEGGVLHTRVDKNGEIWRVVVPTCLRQDLIKHVHCLYGHYGAKKVEFVIRSLFHWGGMHADIVATLELCEICSKTKPPNKNYAGPLQPILPSNPNEILAIDFYGPLPAFRGCKYLLVTYDLFSKLVSAYPLKNADTSSTIKVLMSKQFTTVGKPYAILSDHGTPFTSKEWIDWVAQQGIIHHLTSVRNPQSNPCERVMRELGRLFRTYLNDNHRQWYNQVERITQLINLACSESTGFAPFQLHYGKAPPLLLKYKPPGDNRSVDQEADREQARKKMHRMANIRQLKFKSNCLTYRAGDKVMVRTHRVSIPQKLKYKKFFPLYEGPCTVLEVYGLNAVKIKYENGRTGVFNVRSLKPIKE